MYLIFSIYWTVVGEQCHVLTRFHMEIWDTNFEDSVQELTRPKQHSYDEQDGEADKTSKQSMVPYFQSLKDVKIKCESYVEYLPPELFYYIFDCHSQLSIVQVNLSF